MQHAFGKPPEYEILVDDTGLALRNNAHERIARISD